LHGVVLKKLPPDFLEKVIETNVFKQSYIRAEGKNRNHSVSKAMGEELP
jgi:hypothetical protein